MYTFGALDTYKISHFKKNEKFSIDYKVLIRLYQPIIGSFSMCLYLTLESESSLNKYSKTSMTISRLLKLIQCDENQFNHAIENLKECGLLSYKANQRNANDFLFVLYPTKSASEFLNDEKLSKDLQVVVEDNYYRQVNNYFINNLIHEDEYVDIEDISVLAPIKEDDFYKQFFEKYPMIAMVDNAISESDKKEIARVKKLFSLNYNEIENAILNSFTYVDNKMKLDINKLNDFIELKFQKKEKELTGDDKIARTFEEQRSISYYKKLSGRSALLPRESAMISELLDRYQISEGVLNVVINYYFTYGKSTIGNPKNYFIKVIEEMQLNNVSTTIDAMNYFRNRNKAMKSYIENKKSMKDYSYNNKKEEKKDTQEIEDKKEEVDKDLVDELKKLMGV
ncbi:MAG: DnaD domain protein [Erysipelotrichaceae bacterium]|nr:DnaD domain protein [Erysipelotrichaceae bacterium]